MALWEMRKSSKMHLSDISHSHHGWACLDLRVCNPTRADFMCFLCLLCKQHYIHTLILRTPYLQMRISCRDSDPLLCIGAFAERGLAFLDVDTSSCLACGVAFAELWTYIIPCSPTWFLLGLDASWHNFLPFLSNFPFLLFFSARLGVRDPLVWWWKERS